jgi:hypothetical protein
MTDLMDRLNRYCFRAFATEEEARCIPGHTEKTQ